MTTSAAAPTQGAQDARPPPVEGGALPLAPFERSPPPFFPPPPFEYFPPPPFEYFPPPPFEYFPPPLSYPLLGGELLPEPIPPPLVHRGELLPEPIPPPLVDGGELLPPSELDGAGPKGSAGLMEFAGSFPLAPPPGGPVDVSALPPGVGEIFGDEELRGRLCVFCRSGRNLVWGDGEDPVLVRAFCGSCLCVLHAQPKFLCPCGATRCLDHLGQPMGALCTECWKEKRGRRRRGRRACRRRRRRRRR